MKWILWISVGLILNVNAFAQQERSHIRKGNKLYSEGKLEEASSEYNEALGVKNDLTEGVFNLGNVAYQSKDFETAVKQFETAAMMSENDQVKAKAYHNIGNSLLEAKQYDKSIEAYKNALRLNPKDMETRYNLAYAMEMLRQNPQQQQQDQQKQDQDQEKKDQDQQQQDQQNQENQDQQSQQQKQEEQNQDQQDQQAQNQQGQDQQEQQQAQPREGQLTKEEAERLLEALRHEEQKVQENLVNKKIKAEKRTIEKDW